MLFRSDEQMHRQVMEQLRQTFRPEFLNRVDDTIVFHRLSQENMQAIARNMLLQVTQRFEKLGLSLLVPGDTEKWIAKVGYDEKYGARPLKRTLQQNIEDAAAQLLLEGRIKPGDRLSALLDENGIVLTVA